MQEEKSQEGSEFTKGSYSLEVGKKGESRLRVLNHVHNKESIHVLKSHGLQSGMRVLEMGCGIGIMTSEIAKIVGDEGEVTAMDYSEKQLALSSVEARKNGVSNINFVHLSAYDLEQLDGEFDVIYCRYLLMHLKDPKRVLSMAKKLLKIGGMLVVEEAAGLDGMVCYPESSVYNLLADSIKSQPKMFDTDFSIGIKLANICKDLGGFNIERASMYQPLLVTEYEKSLFTLGAFECGPSMVAAKLCTPEVLQEIQEGLLLLQADKNTVYSYTRVGQLVARKFE